MEFDYFFSILKEGLETFVASNRSANNESYSIPIRSIVAIIVGDLAVQNRVVQLLHDQSTIELMNTIFGLSSEARRRYGAAAGCVIWIDCVKLGGPFESKPYRNLHMGTKEEKAEFRRLFDSLQIAGPTVRTKRVHSSSLDLSCDASTEKDSRTPVVSASCVLTKKTELTVSKMNLASCQRYVVECHAEISRLH